MHACPIPFDIVYSMSENFDMDKLNRLADSIHKQFGDDGILTLWMLQGFYDPTEFAPNHVTPLAQWWLHPDNTYAERIKTHFKQTYLNIDDANTVLGNATRKPLVDQEVIYDQDDRGNELYDPGDYDDWSELNVKTVRQLAQCYFAHIPEIDMPINPLYHDTFEWDDLASPESETIERYCDKIDGFMDDPHAVKYLICKGFEPHEHAPAWVHQFAQDRDDQWRMYEALNLSMENAYLDAYHRVSHHSDVLTLPSEFHPENGL